METWNVNAAEADRTTEEAINGEALIALQHQDLKELGMTSVGHRLTVLKGVYEVKLKQNVPLAPDHYVPLCESLLKQRVFRLLTHDSRRRYRK